LGNKAGSVAGKAGKALLDFVAPEVEVEVPMSATQASRAAAGKRWTDAINTVRQEMLEKIGTAGKFTKAGADEATNAGGIKVPELDPSKLLDHHAKLAEHQSKLIESLMKHLDKAKE
jgi:hypothetical protein